MSFLNPVSELVTRFKSTDAGAPQINYAARTAGDVKTVLKACLVTGYGAKASAGWSITNEAGYIAEFISPSAAMSDYRLGIDDTSAANTVWYYQYQNLRVNPSYNSPSKSISNISKSHANNGWTLIVTDRGLCLVEFFNQSSIGELVARITYWGQVKSAQPEVATKNISFFSAGFDAPIARPDFVFGSSANYLHYDIQGNSGLEVITSNLPALRSYGLFGSSSVELVSPIYLYKDNTFIAEQSGVLAKNANSLDTLYGVYETTINNRQVLHICSTVSSANSASIRDYAKVFMIYLDYWEY